MIKQKRILLLILILCGALFVVDFGLFFFELISELIFFIVGAIVLLPFIICVILFVRLLKLLKANPQTQSVEGAAVPIEPKQSEPVSPPPSTSELDARMRELYDILGLKVQYNEDGSIKDIYQLLGIEPTFDVDGNRIDTIYEQLGIAPKFDENGNEIPQVVVIKNGVKKVAKVDTTSRVMTRKVPAEEQEIIIIQETLKKKLEEAQKSGDKVQEQNIRKILERTQKEDKDEKFVEKRPERIDAKSDEGEEKPAPKNKGGEKSSSGGSSSQPKKSSDVKYSLPKSSGGSVAPATLKVGESKKDDGKPKTTGYGAAVDGFFDIITRSRPREKKPEESRGPETSPGQSQPRPEVPRSQSQPRPETQPQREQPRENVRPGQPRMNPYYTDLSIPSLTRSEPQENGRADSMVRFSIGGRRPRREVRNDNASGSIVFEMGNDNKISQQLEARSREPVRECEDFQPQPNDRNFEFQFNFDEKERQKKENEKEKEEERQRELGKA